jgi:hypothetical protein
MQIVLTNDAAARADPSFLADEQTAVAMLTATFTNNITLTFDVGFGTFQGGPIPTPPGGDPRFIAVANPNTTIAAFLTYSQLRDKLLTSGQPNFFTGANLPAGNSINNMSNFYISSGVAKAFGLAVPNPMNQPDGFVGIGTGFTPGPERVAALLHEIGHAMGRYDFNVAHQGVTYPSEFDLMRFVSLGNRLFADTVPSAAAYFSLDGGASRLADWGVSSDPSDFLNPPASNLTPNDPFNEFVGTLGQLTTADILATEALGFTSTLRVTNPSPPPATTAVMVLRQTSPSITDGTYQIYDIGSNAILASYQLGRVGTPWGFVTLGGFNDGDTSDMLLRNANSGAFQVYDIVNNNITVSASLGAVGLNFQVTGFGNFGSLGNTDMMLRDANTGGLQVYNISNNQITGSASLGMVGLDWQFSGVGNFGNVPGESDLLLRNVNTGGLQVYDISNNQITGSAFIGTVGLDWQFSGVGNFSSVPGASDLLLRNSKTGALQVYNIANNQLTGSASLGTVGADYQFAGVAPVSAAGRSDLVLRSVNTGALQAYNIAFNSLAGSASLGAVGLDWQLGGFAADPPTGLTASMGDSSTQVGSSSQLTAMDGSTAQPGTSDFTDANGNAVASSIDPFSFSSSMLNPAAPAATTANMVLRNASNTTATYEIYNLGANSILAGYPLGQVGSDWGFVTLGNFNLTDPSDMLLRNSTSGAFQVYDIADNNIISSTSLGAVGLNWQVMGFGTFGSFGSFGEDDMILRDVNTGRLQVYSIDNNQITGSAFLGTVGLDWQFSGIGNFSGAGTSDLLVRNSNTGGLQVYDISNNQITGSAFIGTVGLDWQFSGVGNFSGVPGESDLLLRNSSTGALQVYNINNNQLTGSAFIGTVGLDWQFAGVAPIRAATASDLVLRNVNTGAFEAYNIANNQLTGSASLGQVGLDWQLGGFAPTGSIPPPLSGPFGSSSQPAAMDGSTSQLVQAMAGFGAGGGATDSLNAAPLSADTSLQTFLTTPQHA